MVVRDSGDAAGSSVVVEAPDPIDTDAIVDLWVDLVRDQRRHGAWLRAEPNRSAAREMISRYLVAGGLRVARDEGAGIVGAVCYEVERGAFEQEAERGVVQTLYVAPDHRDEGVGGALLDAAETDLRDSGVEVVCLQAMVANDDALRFYERRGYRPHRIELEKEVESDIHSRRDR